MRWHLPSPFWFFIWVPGYASSKHNFSYSSFPKERFSEGMWIFKRYSSDKNSFTLR